MSVVTEAPLECEHTFKDVTPERVKAIEKRDLPSWAERLIEKEDLRWKDKKNRYKQLSYLKCSKCELLRVSDKEAS